MDEIDYLSRDVGSNIEYGDSLVTDGGSVHGYQSDNDFDINRAKLIYGMTQTSVGAGLVAGTEYGLEDLGLLAIGSGATITVDAVKDILTG